MNIDWVIHYVQEEICECCDKHNETPIGFSGFSNIHTHGLGKYNHKEICIPIAIAPQLAQALLNECGLRIKYNNVKFVPGYDYTVIKNFPVLFYEFENSNKLYLILPDHNGKFPNDKNCEFPYNKQLFYAQIIEED